MTDPSITRADARHEERIARENRRQALNHAVRLSNGLDPDSTLEAATRFARFLDGEGRRDAGTDAAEASADYDGAPSPNTTAGHRITLGGKDITDSVTGYVMTPAQPITMSEEVTYTWLGTPVEGLNQSVIDLIDAALRWRRHAAPIADPYSIALQGAIDKLDPTSPVTEQHGDTERPIPTLPDDVVDLIRAAHAVTKMEGVPDTSEILRTATALADAVEALTPTTLRTAGIQ